MKNITILPADTYIVVNKTILNEEDKKLITLLYQPIIGHVAVSLYLILIDDLNKSLIMSDDLTHHHLMATMQLKLEDIVIARECSAELVLDTEAGTGGGVHKAHRKQSFHTTDGGVFGRDYTLTLDLPAMGSYLLRLSPEAPNPDAARLSANRALAQKRKAAKAAKAAAEVSDK